MITDGLIKELEVSLKTDFSLEVVRPGGIPKNPDAFRIYFLVIDITDGLELVNQSYGEVFQITLVGRKNSVSGNNEFIDFLQKTRGFFREYKSEKIQLRLDPTVNLNYADGGFLPSAGFNVTIKKLKE